MAKVSAHNCHKLAEVTEDIVHGEGFYDTVRHHFVLRSDGAVLHARSFPKGPTPYDRRRGSYKVAGHVRTSRLPDVESEAHNLLSRVTVSYREHLRSQV